MNNSFLKYALPVIACMGLQACASIVDGSSQSLSVTTEPVTGATCQLSNDSGTWFVTNTPGTVTVHREASDLTLVCKKSGLSGTAKVSSSTKSMAFGNILAGGIIGAAVDHSTGSAFDYPPLITVPMAKGGKLTIIAPPPETDDSAEPDAHARKH